MADIGSYLPSPGSAVWRRDVAPPPSPPGPHQHHHGGGAVMGRDSTRVRHVVIRDAEIWEEPAPYVVYRINVMTEHDHWYLFRRYSQFHSLHKKLVKQYGVNKDLLPPKKISGNLSRQLIDKRRKLLEGYLQKIIHSEPQVSRSAELQVFLDVPTHDVVKVTDILTRHLYLHGDKLLQEATPIALSVNEMYAITRRLQLPRDATGMDPDDVSADPANLYSFVHQLERLRISQPPAPCSVSCTTFDLGSFRSLHTLKLDHVPMSQVGGLVLIQQQLERLSVHRTLRTVHELLVDAAEEKRQGDLFGSADSARPRSPSDSMDGWRLAATAKLVGTRVVVQPWHRLHTLTLSHNSITQLDNSLQVLPALRELTLSYNQLEVLKLHYLCLPSLEKLNLSHNHIHTIQHDKKVLERITHLSLSHNRLSSLDGIVAFVGVCVLNLSFNVVCSGEDLSKLVHLRRLNMLSMTGNPVSSSNGFRIVLLAKFLRKSRMVSIDGLELTPKEQAKIKSYKSKFGSDPDLWPVAKSMHLHSTSHLSRSKKPHPPSSGEQRPESTTPTSPHVDLSWQIHNDGGQEAVVHAPPTWSRPTSARSDRHSMDRVSFPSSSNDSLEPSALQSAYPGERGQFSTPQLSRGYGTPQLARGQEKRMLSSSFSGAVSEELYSVGVSHQAVELARGQYKGFSPRPEPDGQSDISSTSPDSVRQRHYQNRFDQLSPYHFILSTPPCTPIPTDEREPLTTPITPAMLQSALDALEGIADKDTPLSLTPRQHYTESGPNAVLPEAVTIALTKWISSQSLPGAGNTSEGTSQSSVKTTPLLTPPPSTPVSTPIRNSSFEQSPSHGISAGDLIAALSTLKVCPVEDKLWSGGPSVPAGTPNETSGGIEEWARMGIRPAAVIQALSALTIQQEEEQEEQDEEDGHRVCPQYRAEPSEPSDVEATPPPQLDTVPSESADFLCLFPETPSDPTSTSPEQHGSQSSYEQEVGVANDSYLVEVDGSVMESRLPSHTHQLDNEFAELDPYLSPPQCDSDLNLDPSLSVKQQQPDNEWTGVVDEVGDVDIARETETPLVRGVTTGEGAVEREESTSPPDNVLYS